MRVTTSFISHEKRGATGHTFYVFLFSLLICVCVRRNIALFFYMFLLDADRVCTALNFRFITLVLITSFT